MVGGTACIIRADRGTENVHVECMQRFFRRLSQDDFAGDKSFMYGRSTSNQQIEAWWSLLRKACTDWWIRYFKDLRDQGLYNDDNVIHRECTVARKGHDPPTFLSTNILDTLRLTWRHFRYVATYVATF